MTKEEVIEILERFVLGAKPCSQREIVDACASAYTMLKEQPFLPSDLDEAAEKIVRDWLAYGDGEYKKLVITGAEWMAGQGESIVAKIGLATEEICCTISEKTLDSLGVRADDEIILQIRKKQ